MTQTIIDTNKISFQWKTRFFVIPNRLLTSFSLITFVSPQYVTSIPLSRLSGFNQRGMWTERIFGPLQSLKGTFSPCARLLQQRFLYLFF